MKRLERCVCFLAVLGFISGMVPFAAGGEVEEGFTSIFNGKDLSGWEGDPRLWSVKDGVIRGETTKENPAKQNTFLIWRAGTLDDFELRLSFRISSGNSGVQIRSKDRENWRVTGYQVEVVPNRDQMGLFYDEGGRGHLALAGEKVVINDQGEKQVVGSVGERKEIQSRYKEKEWNDLDVVARGSHLVQKINGVVSSELTDEDEKGRALSGILALQIHAGPPMLVEYKDIRLKTLTEGIALFNGKDLTGWKIVEAEDFEWHGKVYVKDSAIRLEEGGPFTGIARTGEFPKDNYEVNLEAMRASGYDFFCGMTFPVADSWCTLIVGGWGGMVVGLSNVDDLNASENQTTLGMSFEDKRWYSIQLRVTEPKIEVWIDKKKVIDIASKGHKFGVWREQQPIKPFGVATWNTGGALRNITLRKLDK
jgi:hypothetical protein